MKIRRAHQFYRDVFTTPLVGRQSAQAAAWPNLMNGFINAASCTEALAADDRTLALLATYCNLFHDRNLRAFDNEAVQSTVRQLCDRLVQESASVDRLVTAAKALLRSNQIDAFQAFVARHAEALADADDIKAMQSMVHVFDDDHAAIVDHLGDLLHSPEYKSHFIVQVLGMTALYKLGAPPEEPLDLAHIVQQHQAPAPAIDWLARPDAHASAIVLVACDDHYLRQHALYNFLSFASVGGGQAGFQYHFHLYNPSQDSIETLMRLPHLFPQIGISISQERIQLAPPQLKPAYTINRFMAAHGLVAQTKLPVLLTDADALWRKPPPATLHAHDLAFCEPDNAPFWESILGGACYFSPSEPSTFMLSLMTAFAQRIHARGQSALFQDQLGLKVANDVMRTHFQPRQLQLQAQEWCDTQHRDDATLWQVTTRKNQPKFSQYKHSLHALIR